MATPAKTSSFPYILIAIVIGTGVLYIIGRSLVSSQAFPSLSEYLASTTPAVQTSTSSLVSIETPKGHIDAFVASTPDELSKGLSGTESLKSDQGMLFIFPIADKYEFWMKEMNYPIDIIWIDEGKTVIGIVSDLATSTYPETFLPPGFVKYVLETNAGGAERFGISTGTIIAF